MGLYCIEMLFINKICVYQQLFRCCLILTIGAGVVVAATSSESDDKTKCPGPLAYYKSLNCKPVYENEGDCCATKYDCSELETHRPDKCYVNNHEYSVGDKLLEEDANPCDVDCKCTSGYDGVAAFTCAVVDCFFGPVKPGCYRKRSPATCCPEEEICPENPDARAKCVVNGSTYLDGEHFNVPSDPDLNCICQPGYEGKNEAPFCEKPKRPYCSPEFRDASDIYNHCAPVYYSNQSPSTSCSVFSKCQAGCDKLISNSDDRSEEFTCVFGNITMQLGDELNVVDCVKCKCEVGPTPTCQRLPDDLCIPGGLGCNKTLT